MDDETLAIMFRAMLSYSTGEAVQLDGPLHFLWLSLKATLDRDQLKYNSVCERNKKNGKKGGRPNNPENPVGSLGTDVNPEEPKKPDSDSDSDSDKDSDSDRDSDRDKDSQSLKKGAKAPALSLEERIEEFSLNVRQDNLLGDFLPEEGLQEFLSYWTEHSLNAKKFRAEKEKIFGISRRLSSWAKRSNSFNSQHQPQKKLTFDEKLKLRYGNG